ncbi:MAG: hypothetical protein J1G04_07320, partial [Clostridiales bacterium]|nr:hypothetical protein [Clostridiales bacterium]
QPNPNGEENRPTPVAVNIYAVDAVNDVAGVTKNNTDRVTVTTIMVNIQNDRPEIATTGRVLVCPYCGKSDHVRQINANTATCTDCNKSFKSLDPEQLGYAITFSNENGYVMDLTLKNGQSINVNIADIIDDADIDMDAYVMLNTGGENSLMDRTGNTLSTVRAGDEAAFTVTYHSAANKYRVTTLSYITFSCRSTTRDAVAVCNVKFRDSYISSETNILTIRLRVGNIAPTVKDGARTNLTVMGVSASATDEELAGSYVEYSILDFITDANGDNYDPAAEGNTTRTPTYTFIDEIVVYTRLDDLAANRPDLYGPNLMGETTNEETGETEYSYSADTACMVNWVADDSSHQKFRIEFLKGIFGVQKVTLRIYDSGYEDGLLESVVGDLLELTLYITVANPLDDVEEVLDTREMVYGVTGTIYVSELLGEDNAKGYEIIDIKEINTSYLRIYGPDSVATSADIGIGNWRIQAATENVKTQVKVTFSAGEITRERILPINIVANKKPTLKQDYYRYTVSMLDDKANRTIKIKPTDWFTDEDAEDIMTFISPVTSSQTVKVEVLRAYESEEDGGQPYIMLKFLRRGESVITVNLTDLSGRSYKYEVKVECTDAPVLSWWEDKMALIEANWMWFWIIVAAILVVLIVLIIVIVITVKKRKMRREIEALLESETELEAEMLKLSMGPAAFPSFGYLPPTQAQPNPGMMLGGGQSAPQQQSLQLNAGVGTPPPPPPPPPQQQPGYGAPQQPGYGAQPTQPPMGGDGFDPNNF